MGIVALRVHPCASGTCGTIYNTSDMGACPCPLLYIVVIFLTQETYSVALRPSTAAVAESLISASSFLTPSMKSGSGAFTRITKAVGTLSSAAFWQGGTGAHTYDV